MTDLRPPRAVFFIGGSMNEFQKKVLSFLGIPPDRVEYYLRKIELSELESPERFLQMKEAAERIRRAIENSEKIMVYGDYDCDGISAVSILVKMFLMLNVKVGYYIPSRYIDGYGLNPTRAEQIVNKGYRLVITVDNGVAAHEAIALLMSNGIDVILTDHHEITRDLPGCSYILHPDRKKDDYHLKECGAYVAFMLATEILGTVDDYLLCLAGQATISDMMPLKEENRVLLKLALSAMNRHKEYPFHLLVKNGEEITEETLAFTICPKINAFGRVKEDSSVNDMVRFFTSEDELTRRKIAREIEVTNAFRRELLSEAIRTVDPSECMSSRIAIVRKDEISEGLIGLLAARIVGDYEKPCIVFTKAKDGVLKGSARSLPGLDLSEAFTALSDLLLVYGGHAEAGGLSLKEENYQSFCDRMEAYCADKAIQVEEERAIPATVADLNYENYRFLKALGPYGMDFPLPKFQLDISCSSLSYMGAQGNHIRGALSPEVSFVGFSLADQVRGKTSVTAVGVLTEDTYKKGRFLTFRIDKLIG